MVHEAGHDACGGVGAPVAVEQHHVDGGRARRPGLGDAAEDVDPRIVGEHLGQATLHEVVVAHEGDGDRSLLHGSDGRCGRCAARQRGISDPSFGGPVGFLRSVAMDMADTALARLVHGAVIFGAEVDELVRLAAGRPQVLRLAAAIVAGRAGSSADGAPG